MNKGNYSRPSKVKRLTDDPKQKNLSSKVSARHIPQMSDTALKRWNEARETYLGGRHPQISKPRRVKQKIDKEPVSIILLEPDQMNKTEFQALPLEQPPLPPPPEEIETIHDHVDDKCVGTETDESVLFNTEVAQVDEAIQADLPSPQVEEQQEDNSNTLENEQKQEIQSNHEPVEYDDKATETDLIFNITKDDEIDRQISKDTFIESIPNIENSTEPNNDDNDDTKAILSSPKSELSIHEQLRRLRHRFKRVSKERRLLTCLLALYLIIMFGLLIVIFILLWAFQERSLILNQEVKMIHTKMINGVARYGESCHHDNDCQRPFTCFKKRSSTSGNCRCPMRYDFANNQCIGALNALCKKDADCQRYMLCSGMNDGTRRCQCQTLYHYDDDRRQCRGDYQAPCQSHTDCRANLICNKTMNPSLCSCQVNYRYYPLVHKCRGDSGAICEQATAECIDNAECRDGVCECAFQFIPNEKKMCVDPCPKVALNRVKIRYPGNCRRFIDCRQRTKNECPEPTIFNFRTQLCDYRKNVLDC